MDVARFFVADPNAPPVSAGHAWRARSRRNLLVLVAMMLSVLASPLAVCSDAGVSRELQLKAAFVYNFTKFIEWPAQNFSDAHAPIVIGVLGQTQFTDELEQVVQNRTVNGRAIRVKSVQAASDASAIHVLFVTASGEARWSQLSAAIGSSPVVSIGESPSFAQSGGTINFVLLDDKVRFEINMTAAERAGLRISAQLQKLAVAVRRDP